MWGRGVLPVSLPARFSTTLSPALSVYLCENVGPQGLLVVRLPAPFHPTLRQSWSRQGKDSPLRPGCPSPPLLPVWMNVYFLCPWCWTSLLFDFLSVLVVRGDAVCLPTPPSWFSVCGFLTSCRKDFTAQVQVTENTFVKAGDKEVLRVEKATEELMLGCLSPLGSQRKGGFRGRFRGLAWDKPPVTHCLRV